MEFEGVFSAVVAAVLISIGVGGDWARWTNVRNEGAFAQAAPHISEVAYKEPGRINHNAVRAVKRSSSSCSLESASSGTRTLPETEFPSAGSCSGASFWTIGAAGEPRSSGVTIAGNFSLNTAPADNNWDILTGEPAE
jgi:hypothetical protein